MAGPGNETDRDGGKEMTLSEHCEDMRDIVRHALEGEVWAGEDREGRPVWERAVRHDECVDAAMGAVDELAYQLIELADSGRAMERVMGDHGLSLGDGTLGFGEYLRALAEEKRRFPRTYAFHGDLEELYAEAAEALSDPDSPLADGTVSAQENDRAADKN